MTDENRKRSFLAERLRGDDSEPADDKGEGDAAVPWFNAALRKRREVRRLSLFHNNNDQPPDAA